MFKFCRRIVSVLKYFTFTIACLPVYGQLTADFSASVTEGCAPLVVTFQDISVGEPNEWEWDLGNENISILQNPSTVYNQPGRYEVKLIIKQGNNSDTVVKTAFITVYGNPTSNFSASSVEECVPFETQFTDLTMVGANDDDIVDWQWDFGDGKVSKAQNPLHTYEQPGIYPVTLITTDTRGCKNITFKGDFIRAEGSIVNFSSDQQFVCNAPAIVRFQNQSTTLSSQPANVLWDFGDGQTSTENNPVHAYTKDGIYSVKLTVQADECTNELLREDYIRISGSAGVDFATSSQVCEGQRAQFENRSSASAIAQEWDFGEGTKSFLPNPFHQYNKAGSYQVKLKLFFGRNCEDSLTKTIEVLPTPVANFSIGEGLCEGTRFLNESVNATSYLWDFGDSTASTLAQPIHVYEKPGTYPVTLTATNSLGCSVTLKKDIEVFPAISAAIGINVTEFGSEIKAGCVPFNVVFTDSTFSVPNVVSWEWDFGDGTNSDRRNPAKTFEETGRYPVTLTATNEWGCVSSVTDTVIVTNPPEFADFTFSKSVVCLGEEVELVGIASDEATNFIWDFQDGTTPREQSLTHRFGKTGNIRIDFFALNEGCPRVVSKFITVLPSDPSFEIIKDCNNPYTLKFGNISVGAEQSVWNFDDGTQSNEFSPTHTFAERGRYDIKLTTTNFTTGCPDVTFTSVYFITDPIAKFEVENETPYCIPNTIQFTDKSQDAEEWFWNFGDGTTSTAQNPKKSYNNPGKYDVTLTITDMNGCQNTLKVDDAVQILDLMPDFTVDNVEGCEDLTVQFANLTQANPSASSFFWDFGDSTTSTLAVPTHTYKEFGQYDVSLTATNAEGTCTLTKLKTIEFLPPAADFEADLTYTCPSTEIFFSNVSFNAATSLWDFGDGTTSTERNPVKSYTENGNYTITLTVANERGCVSTLTKEAYILVEQPLARFSSSGLQADCPPLVTRFTDESVGENIIGWEWDFGDGNSSFLPNPSHAYTLPGVYDVKLTVTNLAGCQDSLLLEEIILVDGPLGSFEYEYDARCENLTVNFASEAINTVKYTWDFADGTLGEGAVVSHTYPRGGIYNPTLLLEDENGCSFFIEAEVPVEIIKPVANFEVESRVSDCPPFEASFTDKSSANTIAWKWDFGDGNFSESRNPIHFYKAPGRYTVQLIVESDLGCLDTLTRNEFIEIGGPTGSLSFDPGSGCTELEVTFEAASEKAVSYFWEFGDGSTSEGKTVAYIYENAGTYYPSVTFTDSLGCAFKITSTDSIVVTQTPTASYESETNNPFTNEAVQFSDKSTNATSWLWDFGDGTTSTEQNPQHTYTTPGEYFGRLIVSFGICKDTIEFQPIFIEDRIQYIPNVFTPNNDNKNETFFIENIIGDNWDLKIYNRWGALIFEQKEYDNSWRAENTTTGLYYYELSNKRRKKQFKGWVKVLR